jgi:hypothetical protein
MTKMLAGRKCYWGNKMGGLFKKMHSLSPASILAEKLDMPILAPLHSALKDPKKRAPQPAQKAQKLGKSLLTEVEAELDG